MNSSTGSRLAGPQDLNRAPTGVPGLDGKLDGGFPLNRTVLVDGAPGTGKTTLGLQFLAEGLRREEPAVLACVDRNPANLIKDAHTFGWDLEEAISRGSLVAIDASPWVSKARRKGKNGLEADGRQVVSDLSEQVRRVGARRLMIDAFTSLVPPEMPLSAAGDFLRVLIFSLEDDLGCTTMLTARGGDDQAVIATAAHLVSGILELRVVRGGRGFVRTLFVRKMRGAAADPDEHAFVIDGRKGVVLLL